jgi:iron-sulfur cluster insertion protein
MVDSAAGESRSFQLTERAAQRIAELVRQEQAAPGTRLRVAVSGGGCSGFQYGFSFDEQTTGDDHLFEKAGVQVVVDDSSLDLLSGGQLDWVEDMVGSSFQITNPNAESSCGCGNSFAVAV